MAVHSLLGSYMVQIVHGDWSPDTPSDPQGLSQHYANFKFAPKHSTELLTRIYQLHQGHKYVDMLNYDKIKNNISEDRHLQKQN